MAPTPGESGGERRDHDADDIELDDEDLDFNDSAVSGAVLGMVAVALIVGLAFGWIAMSSYNTRQMYQARTDQAQQVLEAVEPKAEAFGKAQKIIQGMDPEMAEYEKVKKLGELDVAIDMSVIRSDKLFLGGERMAMLISYLVEAQRLQEMIEEHDRKTNEVDREELEKIVGSKEEQEETKDQQYAAVFNFNHYKSAITQDDYQPSTGKLVTISGLEEAKEGKVDYSMMNSDRSGEVDIRGVVPLSKGDVLTAGGENAFKRYQARVGEMKHLVEQMQGRPEALTDKLKDLAERSSPPIVSL